MSTDISELGFELPELDIIAGFDSQDGAAEDEELGDDGYRRAGYLSQRRDEEEAHGGDDDATAEAGHSNDALQACEFYFLLLGHSH